MVRVHRELLSRLEPPVPALLLGTPFGFQENRDELAARIVGYFRESLRQLIEVAGEGEQLTRQLRDASYVFAGPGSPSYALRRWTGTVVPELLSEKLRYAGAVTFSSAAALTLGTHTVPVYEIYKVGEDPCWHTGMDVLGAVGLSAAVIPHFDNAEGGTHDTRYCYLGERRLTMLETQLPDEVFVLGIDEHTALRLDLVQGSASVDGLGSVTLRHHGRSRTIPHGSEMGLCELTELVHELDRRPSDQRVAPLDGHPGEIRDSSDGVAPLGAVRGVSPLIEITRAAEQRFTAAVGNKAMHDAVEAALGLEQAAAEWASDTTTGGEIERARASLRSMLAELGELGIAGTRDPRELVGPYIEMLLELRAAARSQRRFLEADQIRDRLGELGVEIRDAPSGSSWELVGRSGADC
jgi:hypothetical protein